MLLFLTTWFKSLENWFMGGIRKNLEKQVRKSLELCQCNLVTNLIAQKTRMLIEHGY